MKYFKIVLILILVQQLQFAQKQKLTIEDVVFNSYSKLAPERLSQLSWIPKSVEISFVKNDTLFSQNINGKNKKAKINLEEINNIFEKVGIEKLKRFPNMDWIDKNSLAGWIDTNFVKLDLNSSQAEIICKVPSAAENKTVSPNNNYAAYTIENNLFLSIEGKQKNITNEINKGIVSGQAVSRNEFGIKNGIFWSPKNNYLAFYQKDESNVTDYPIVEIGPAPAKLKNIKYPMAGQTSEEVKVGVYNLNNDKIIWLETGNEKEQYLTNVTWDPSEKYIYIAHLNRDQNHMRLIKYNVENGKQIKILFEEKDNEYVEPENQLQFICEDEDKFIWFSERDGWQHLYLYNTEGELLKQITAGEWIVKNIVGFNKDEKELYFIGTKDTPVQDHIYKVSFKTNKITRISELGYNHQVNYNEHNNCFTDVYSNFETPRITQIINSSGKKLSNILTSENPISNYEFSKPKIFTLKGENNIDLYSSIILPTDFDSTKKYPVIVYVYGGPHAQLVTDHWYFGRYDFWFQYMAQNGYIVFTLDNRGSENRGLEFEQAVFRNLGTKEVDDQLVGINYLKSLNYVDAERVGVFGWSYGGFMTTSLMLRTNNAFKVGVGGGAVIDWKFYEVMYTERYMDTPETNPEGYKNASLLNYVENLNGRLLLVHGTSDPTVVWENTLEFAKKAASLNKPLDYFPYIGHGHGVGGKDALHLYTKISNYFFDNL